MTNIQIIPTEITSERLILRKFQQGDEISLFHEYCGDIESSRFLQRAPHQNVAQTRSSLELWASEHWEQQHPNFAWVISHKETNLAMGLLYFFTREVSVRELSAHESFGEIHFGIGAKFQKQGYMVEAIDAVIDYLRHNNLVRTIKTFCDVEHIASQNVLLNTGFKQNELLKQWAKFPMLGEEARDCISYQIEW